MVLKENNLQPFKIKHLHGLFTANRRKTVKCSVGWAPIKSVNFDTPINFYGFGVRTIKWLWEQQLLY